MENLVQRPLYDFLEHISDGFVALDKDWRYVYVNKRGAEMLGRRPEVLIGKHIWTEFPEGIGQPFYKAYYKAMEEHVSIQIEAYYPPWDRWFENRIYPFPEGLAIFYTEITQRKKTEKALEQERNTAQKYLDVAKTIMLVIGKDQRVSLINKKGCQVLGYREEEIIRKDWIDNFLPQRIRTDIKDVFSRIIAGELPPFEYFENPILTKNGEERLIAWHNTLLTDEKGNITGTLSSGEDITDRKQAEEKIRTVNEELRALNRIIMSCSNVLDTREILNKVLDEAIQITGLEGGAICLVGPDETLHFTVQRGTSEATIQDLTTHTIKVGDCLCGMCARNLEPLILPNRESVLQFTTRESTRGEGFRFHAAFPLMAAGKCTGVLCIFTRTDHKPSERSLKLLETITASVALAIDNARLYEELARHAVKLEEKVRERTVELEQANVKLKELDRLKSMFIASMSHELRTPLNSIIGFTGIILMGMSGEISGEQRKQLSIVQKSARHLLELITDVIDVSKIEAEKVELFLKEFDLSSLLREVMESFTHAAAEKGLRLSLDAPEKLIVRSDERRIKQVLNNLLSNAIKFTEQGGVEITLLETWERITIRVRDTGIGIKSEDQENLFKAFSKFSHEGIPRREGTGLGLYLSRKIAGLLGGELQAESEFGKGSAFTFEFPKAL